MNDFEKEIDFNIKLIKGWQDQTMYYFRGPNVDDTDHEIVLNIDRSLQHDDINDFARDRIEPIKQSLQGLEVLKEEEVTIEDGNPAFELVFKWIPADELVEMHKYVFVFKDDMGFTFNCRFTRKSYKLLGLQYKEIIERLLPGTYDLEG